MPSQNPVFYFTVREQLLPLIRSAKEQVFSKEEIVYYITTAMFDCVNKLQLAGILSKQLDLQGKP